MNEYISANSRRSVAGLAIALALAGCADDSVRIDRADRIGFSTGDVTFRRNGDRVPVAARAVVMVDGERTTYEGTIASDGSITIPGVPEGPYVLEVELPPDPRFPTQPGVRTSYPMTKRRARIGGDWWVRAGVETAESAETAISISATGLAPWKDDETGTDSIDLVSRRADLLTNVSPSLGSTGDPETDATAITRWTIPLSETFLLFGDDVPLVDASRGDDLVLVQRRRTPISIDDPGSVWRSSDFDRVIASAPTSGVTFVDGATTEISTTFTELPTTPYELDFRGSEFLAYREALGLPENTRAYANVEVVSEPGEGPDYFIASTPTLWSIAAFTAALPVDPECASDPDTGECDFAMCPEGCDVTVRVHPGDLRMTIDVPDAFPDARDVLSVSYGFSVPWTHPTTMDGKSASFGMSIYRRAASGTPVTVVISPPRNVQVDAQEVPLTDSTGVRESPVVTWDAPEVGTAGHYVVQVFDLTTVTSTDGEEIALRSVGSFATLGTSVTIPEGTLVSGRYYRVRVTAHTYAWDDEVLAQPHGDDFASAWSSTGALLAD